MNQRKKAVFNWSGGKDSALALQKTIDNNEFEIVSLFTMLNERTGTSSIHSIPIEILTKQAESIGIPLYTVVFEKDLKNYEKKMYETITHFKLQGVTHFIFGDIFLADVKTYRESKLNPFGIEVVEPLWNKTSAEIMDDFLLSGIKSKIIVTQAEKLDKTFIGKDLDQNTIKLFPNDIDICGENGEYHTFSYAGRLFKKEINFELLDTDTISYTINLDDGKIKTFEYWQARMIAK